MAIELNLASTVKSAPAKEARQTAMVWLNIGVPSVNENGEAIFVSLPVGIPLDTMEAKPITGSNENWKQLLQAKNALMEMLKDASANLKPGEEDIVSDLQVQIRRVDDVVAPVSGNNPLMATLGTLSFAKKAA